jgi:hypothetical protein
MFAFYNIGVQNEYLKHKEEAKTYYEKALVSSKELNDENVRINCQKALKDLSL